MKIPAFSCTVSYYQIWISINIKNLKRNTVLASSEFSTRISTYSLWNIIHMYWTGGLCVRFDRPLPLMEQHNFHPHCHCQEADSCCFSFVFPVLVFLECENFSLQQLFGATVNKNIYFTIFKQLFFTRPFQLSFISLFIYKDTLKLILSELGLNWFADKAKIYATSHNILKNSYILNVRQLGPTLPWPWQVSPS